MRPIGFSTGAIAKSNFVAAVELLRETHTRAIELSALRLHELLPLWQYARAQAFDSFAFVSVHAPSAFSASDEQVVVGALAQFAERGWPIVVHPDAIHQPGYWGSLGSMLLVENMDKRKPIGRTATELRYIFAHLPQASLCFDLAHARQVDSSMTEAYLIVREFATRIRQLHISDVSSSSRHSRLSPISIESYLSIAPMLPPDAPAIIESPVEPSAIGLEIEHAMAALNEPQFATRPNPFVAGR